ncbi:MAG: diaminopimelate decarboxylase [Elusimicrobia bacterium RIFOXYB2_FULL_62_6]|nr:MAG: diaminopimelate decarboxylase [Elusimicrobia bacterium RIFOXYB2_FULL_62_6]
MINDTFPSKLVEQIIRKTGTPVYIYSRPKILDNLNSYKKAFSAFDPLFCYAMKANSSGAIAAILAENGAGADVVSGGELYRALKAGFKPGRVIFSGVGKTAGEIAAALRAGILFINAESMEELRAVEAIAARLKIKAPVSVRINPDVDPHTHKYIATGKLGTKFGVSFKEARALYAFAAASRHLQAVGLQFHLGSQIHSARPYLLALAEAGAFVRALREKGVPLQYMDIGGGWGGREGGDMLSPSLLAKAIAGEMGKLQGLRLILEPGRSLVASAGALAVTTLYRKASGSKKYVITDGAMNDLIRPALYGAKHPVAALEKKKGPLVKFDLAGPVCESGDFLALNVRLPMPSQGDALLVLSAGAYGFSMSSQYNSRPRAAEALITGPGSWRLIRRRETFRDLVAAEKR